MLDACRYDAFKVAIKGFDINGELERRNSEVGTTKTFLSKYVKNKDTSNFEAISQNPFFYSEKYLGFKPFDKIHKVEVGKNFYPFPPRTTSKARKLMKEHPNKKFLIHYLKPHFPFTEPEHYKDKLLEKWISQNDDLGIPVKDMEFRGGGRDEYLNFNTRRDLLEKYFNNLLVGLEEVEKVLKFIDNEKQVIITADHGECLGSSKVHNWLGHFRSPIEELKIVPWMEIQ